MRDQCPLSPELTICPVDCFDMELLTQISSSYTTKLSGMIAPAMHLHTPLLRNLVLDSNRGTSAVFLNRYHITYPNRKSRQQRLQL
jgi:hypothetical protein